MGLANFCVGVAKLTIPETGEIFEVNPEDLDWESECSDPDRGMGAELHHYATISFESEHSDYQVEATWHIWEYPIGSINNVDVEAEEDSLLKDFDDYQLPYEDYVDEEQLDAILSNTKFHSTFSDEILRLQKLSRLNVTDLDKKMLNRLVFIGVINCLETYLSDAFINTVLSKKVYLRSFFSSFKEFKYKKINLGDLFIYFDEAEKHATKAMADVTYHNLSKVAKMYESTFSIDFPNFSDIQKYISIRHDLVHRNGKTKEGKKIDINEDDVNKLIDKTKVFIDKLDQELRSKEKAD